MAKTATDTAAAAETVAQAATKGFEQTLASLKDGMAQASSNFETTQAKVKENMDKVMKSAEEFFAFGQGNLDAFVKSAQIWTAGVQDIGKAAASTAQANFDASVAAFKALGGTKSFKDAVDVQSNLARTSLEKATAEAGKLTEASLKLAEQSFAPIAARLTLAAEKFAKPV
jgi:hypothetical protein